MVPGTLLEDKTREAIDQKLEAAGWVIQDKKRLNLYESLGVAVREVFDEGSAFSCKVTPDAPGKSRFGLVDCVGVIETNKIEITAPCKTGILVSFDLQPVFIERSTIRAAA